MDKELKAKWVAALRGKEHGQATGVLRKPDGSGFCCLGVLLDVAKHGDWNGDEYYIAREGDNDLILSGELEGYAGSLGLTHDQELTLIRMNDGCKDKGIKTHTFEEIADHIEANL